MSVTREPGRIRPSPSPRRGATQLWDGRFLVEVPAGKIGLEIAPLGREGRCALPQEITAQLRQQFVPAAAIEALPAVRIDDRLLGCPPLDWPAEIAELGVRAYFRPYVGLTTAPFLRAIVV